MNWDAIGAAAEFLGATGVIASLIYVAAQVRYSNRASTVQAKLETTRFMTDYGDLLLQYPALHDVRQRGLADLGSLSPEEFDQFNHLALKAFWFFSAGYFQHRQRTLAEDDWYELRAVARYWLHFEGCLDWWQRVGRFMFGPHFVAFIEGEIDALAAQQGAAADQQELG
jgi:hypothetical protein